MNKHQKVKINNYCTIKYKPDHIYATRKILQKVPEKYLVGLESINFYDDRKFPNTRYVKGKPFSRPSRIDVYMGGFAESQKFSLMDFNILINPNIIRHIVKYLQPKSKDKDILSYRNGRYDPDWLYFGIWSPMLIPISFGRYLYNRNKIFRSYLDIKINRVLEKYYKSNTQHRH